METIMDQKFVLFLKTLKTNFIRYSVSPGHVHITLYNRTEYRRRLKKSLDSNYQSLRFIYKNKAWSKVHSVS